ncbi:MAG: TraR/DksA family transcriptional regulator [Rhabdochlamydiaceae bacterium]
MPLSQDQISQFKIRLLNLKNQTSHLAKESAQDVRTGEESKGYSQHQADAGTDDFNLMLSVELTTKEYEVIKQIDRALEKIDENTYGICDLSGEEIPLKRLEALPYATMTVKAQEQFEKGLIS